MPPIMISETPGQASRMKKGEDRDEAQTLQVGGNMIHVYFSRSTCATFCMPELAFSP